LNLSKMIEMKTEEMIKAKIKHLFEMRDRAIEIDDWVAVKTAEDQIEILKWVLE